MSSFLSVVFLQYQYILPDIQARNKNEKKNALLVNELQFGELPNCLILKHGEPKSAIIKFF